LKKLRVHYFFFHLLTNTFEQAVTCNWKLGKDI
jgi:hypothetical protein